jgi:hypothetical protein
MSEYSFSYFIELLLCKCASLQSLMPTGNDQPKYEAMSNK